MKERIKPYMVLNLKGRVSCDEAQSIHYNSNFVIWSAVADLVESNRLRIERLVVLASTPAESLCCVLELL